MTIARRLLALSLLVASLALAACGGDDGPTREEFADSANKVCADLEKAGSRLQEPDSVDEIAQFAGDAEGEIDAAVKRLDDLETPGGDDGEKAKQFIEAIKADTNEKIKPALADLRNAAQAKDEKAIVAAAEKIQKVETDRADKLAREIGAGGCAD